MFSIGIPVVCTVLTLYVTWRASSATFFGRRAPARYLFGAAGLLWATCVAGRVFGHGATSRIAGALERVGMCWLGSLILLSVCLLAVDLVTVLGLLLRRRVAALRGAALLAGLALAAVALVQGIRAPVVSRHEVRLPGLPEHLDGTVIVAVSDLHLDHLRGASWLAARVDQIRHEGPDLVAFVGDILERNHPSAGELRAALARLSPPLGYWAVSGNHEFRHGRSDRMRPLEQAGVRVLRDQWAEARTGLVIAGVDDLTDRRRAGQLDGRVAQALARRPSGGAILLSHSPLDARSAAAAGAGLMLSGHTHGGQLWPLGYLVRLRDPLFAGRYEVDGMTVLVCRGTGTWGPRMRLWQPGEIVRVTLRSVSHRAGGLGISPHTSPMPCPRMDDPSTVRTARLDRGGRHTGQAHEVFAEQEVAYCRSTDRKPEQRQKGNPSSDGVTDDCGEERERRQEERRVDQGERTTGHQDGEEGPHIPRRACSCCSGVPERRVRARKPIASN